MPRAKLLCALRAPVLPRRAIGTVPNSPQAELSESIKMLMRGSAQPVAVIAAFMPQKADSSKHIHAATLSSFTTVSLAPPLVAFSLRLPSRLADALRAGVMEHRILSPSVSAAAPTDKPHFLIHLLSQSQQNVSNYFARPGVPPLRVGDKVSPGNPFVENKTTPSRAVDGMHVLDESLGAFACSLVSQIDLTSPDLHGTMFTTPADGAHAEEKGSALFIARINSVEHADGKGGIMPTLAHDRKPLVYYRQKYGTIALP